MFGPCFVIQYFESFLLCNHLDWEERVGCLTLTVFLMYYESLLCLFLRVPWDILQCMVVVFPDHTTCFLDCPFAKN